jgi:hypothetical protein
MLFYALIVAVVIVALRVVLWIVGEDKDVGCRMGYTTRFFYSDRFIHSIACECNYVNCHKHLRKQWCNRN